jgi:hypothetical protein
MLLVQLNTKTNKRKATSKRAGDVIKRRKIKKLPRSKVIHRVLENTVMPEVIAFVSKHHELFGEDIRGMTHQLTHVIPFQLQYTNVTWDTWMQLYKHVNAKERTKTLGLYCRYPTHFKIPEARKMMKLPKPDHVRKIDVVHKSIVCEFIRLIGDATILTLIVGDQFVPVDQSRCVEEFFKQFRSNEFWRLIKRAIRDSAVLQEEFLTHFNQDCSFVEEAHDRTMAKYNRQCGKLADKAAFFYLNNLLAPILVNSIPFGHVKFSSVMASNISGKVSFLHYPQIDETINLYFPSHSDYSPEPKLCWTNKHMDLISRSCLSVDFSKFEIMNETLEVLQSRIPLVVLRIIMMML